MIQEKTVRLGSVELRRTFDDGTRQLTPLVEGEPANPILEAKIAEESAHHEQHNGRIYLRVIDGAPAAFTDEETAKAIVDLGLVPGLTARVEKARLENEVLIGQLAAANAELEKVRALVPAPAPAAPPEPSALETLAAAVPTEGA